MLLGQRGVCCLSLTVRGWFASPRRGLGMGVRRPTRQGGDLDSNSQSPATSATPGPQHRLLHKLHCADRCLLWASAQTSVPGGLPASAPRPCTSLSLHCPPSLSALQHGWTWGPRHSPSVCCFEWSPCVGGWGVPSTLAPFLKECLPVAGSIFLSTQNPSPSRTGLLQSGLALPKPEEGRRPAHRLGEARGCWGPGNRTAELYI